MLVSEINSEHMNQVAEGIQRMMSKPDYYRFTKSIKPKLIVYGSGCEWHVATHDGTAVSRIWSTHTTRQDAVAMYNGMMAANEFKELLASATGKVYIRFDVQMVERTPVFRPIAWRPVEGEGWHQFANAPWLPQSDIYAAVEVCGGQMERECKGTGSQMVYWYQR